MKKRLLTSCLILTVLGSGAGMAGEPLLYEDFSKCTAGTVDQADAVNIGTTEDDDYGMIDDYTLTSGWQAYGLYQAAGTAVLKGLPMYGSTMSEITAPAVTREGGLRVRVRARVYQGDGAAEPVQMRALFAKGWTYSAEKYYTVTSEWQEFVYETKVAAGDWALRLTVANDDYSVSPVQFDYISIEPYEVVAKRPDAPVALQPESFDDTSFRAMWEPVEGISDYRLYVTYKDGDETKFFVEGEKVTIGAYQDYARRVTGLDPETIYSYYVTAVDGDLESEPSNTIAVLGISAPDGLRVTSVEKGALTFAWGRPHKAQKYKATLYRLSGSGSEQVATTETTGTECTFVEADQPGLWACDVKAILEYEGVTSESDASAMRAAAFERSLEGKKVVGEDFSKFAKGSLEDIYYKENDPNDPNTWGEYVNNFQTKEIPEEYTQTPGWKGFGLAEAGGVAAVSYKPYPTTYWGGYIQTPAVAAKSIVTLKFRAASIPQYFTASEENPVKLMISASDSGESYIFDRESTGVKSEITYSYDYETGETFPIVRNFVAIADNDWHDFQITFLYTGDELTPVTISSEQDKTPFFIDDVEVCVQPVYVAAPVAWEADDFTREGFTAYWGEVDGAEDYLLSVYRRKGGKNEYAVTDQVSTSCEAPVTGLDAAYDWFFTVKARIGDVVSEESNAVEAIWVNAPETAAASGLTESSFTANWNRVPKATRYDLVLYRGDKESELAEIKTVEIEEGETLSFVFDGLDTEAGKQFAYALRSYYDTTTKTYESPLSEPEYVDLSNVGVEEITAGVTVARSGSDIVVNAPAGARVEIYSASGITLLNAVSSGYELRLGVGSGLYIVTVEGKVTRLIF